MNGILSIIIGQLMAYHIGCIRGNSVDTPINLSKTVTVD